MKVSAGYTANVIGFGWTNGVYLKLHKLLDDATTGPAARPATAH